MVNGIMMTFRSGSNSSTGWRKYQARVLKELDNYLSNGSLHVVAPPGSGKTVLGLEVMLRLNRPTLILAPSLAIRDQWIDRFCELFLQVNRKPEWVSCDVRRPAFMTVCTYQGLHAACNNLDDDEEGTIAKKEVMLTPRKIANELKSLGVKTVILDEAHHLKNEWWNTLDWLKRQLSPTIVGLTATPPYDVTIAEWQRYIELNGTVDTEITVPELILEGDLCPHQDYVYFSVTFPGGVRPGSTPFERILTSCFGRSRKTPFSWKRFRPTRFGLTFESFGMVFGNMSFTRPCDFQARRG